VSISMQEVEQYFDSYYCNVILAIFWLL